MDAPLSSIERTRKANALLCAGTAYLIWGVVGWYFQIVTVDHRVAPFTLLSHRVVWSLLFILLLLAFRRELGQIRAAFGNRKLLIGLTITSVLIAINWITFIYAAANGKLTQASLGYFLTPIMNVLLGVVVLKESLRVTQTVAVILASAGVGLLVYFKAESVWIPIALMLSWSFYALLRKRFVVNPIVGLGIETAVLLPAALVYLVYDHQTQSAPFTPNTYPMLVAAGVITAIPLILFAAGAKHLKLSTLGLLQYIGPTVQFLIATLVLKEAVNRDQLLSFGFIWIGLLVFSIDSYFSLRNRT